MYDNYPYLNDIDFMNENTQLYHSNTFFVKIAILNWEEKPIKNIEGKIISANITFDGNSRVRRVGNINLLLDEDTINITSASNLFSINKKVEIQVGQKNLTSQKYTDYPILWFPLGVYVIHDVSISHGTEGITASLQIQDKMCLLNGDCGGVIPASTVFDSYITIGQNGEQIILRPTIYQIIQELVNHFGGQQLGKIVISDLDNRIKQVMKWTGDSPLYMMTKSGQNGPQYYITIDSNDYLIHLNNGFVDVPGSPFEYGYDVGYIYTDFSYPGDLICSQGDTVVQVLDKIIEALGNYEYFYDLQGNFVFQEIKNYLNNSQTSTFLNHLSTGNIQASDYLIDLSKGKSVMSFKNSNLINSYNNTPQYSMIKNDFVIWGSRKNTNGSTSAVRYHLAIDEKPKTGNSYRVFQYTDPQDGELRWGRPIYCSSRSEFPNKGTDGSFYYNATDEKIYTWKKNQQGVYEYIVTEYVMENITTTDWRTELYMQGLMADPLSIDSNYYFTELKNEWPKIYDIRNRCFKESTLKSPSNIDFFLDFIDSSEAISEFSVSNIGRRSYVVNNKDINCVFEPNIPDVILLPITESNNNSSQMGKMRQECIQRNQPYYQMDDDIYEGLTVGGGFNSGYQYIRQLLHQYTSYNESVSITCIPLYYLQPNIRISIFDKLSNISGDYIINSISFNLDVNSTMTINAMRALQRI